MNIQLRKTIEEKEIFKRQMEECINQLMTQWTVKKK